MTSQLKYVELEDGAHVIGAGEYTVCGQVIPYPGSSWSVEEPKKLCGRCNTRAEDTDEFGIPEDQIEVPPMPFAAPEPTTDEPASDQPSSAPPADEPEAEPEPVKATKEAKSGTKA